MGDKKIFKLLMQELKDSVKKFELSGTDPYHMPKLDYRAIELSNIWAIVLKFVDSLSYSHLIVKVLTIKELKLIELAQFITQDTYNKL